MRVSGGKGRNEGRPIQGIDTITLFIIFPPWNNLVEMKVAPFRALTQHRQQFDPVGTMCRNEGRPIHGIDTNLLTT